MARNYIKSGDVTTLTAPSGGVVSGTLYIIGALAVVSLHDAAEGQPFEGKSTGEFVLPKVSSQSWTEGAAINWNASTGVASTATTAGFFPIGVATSAAGNGDTVGRVRLNGAGSAALS